MHIVPNGKRYYGITSQKPNDRWKNGKGYEYNKHFYNAINKYGWNNIEHTVLFNDLTEDEAKLLEQCYIVLYDTTNPNKGYNITLGGEGSKGYKHTQKELDKMSKTIKELWKNENYRRKMIEKKIGKNNPNYGKKCENNHRSKSVICVTTKKIFYSASKAANYYNMYDNSHIIKCCKGKIKSVGKLPDGTKLVWRYVNYTHNKKYRIITD